VKFFKTYILPLFVALLVIVGLRTFVVTQYVLTDSTAAPTGLMAGDRVLVNKLAYLQGRSPIRQYVAYRLPDNNQHTTIDRCLAAPGDTVYWHPGAKQISLKRKTSKDLMAIVPKGHYWMERGSYSYGFISRALLVGRAFVVSYSVKSDYSILPSMRGGRWFKKL
jgi:signal peptidase I